MTKEYTGPSRAKPYLIAVLIIALLAVVVVLIWTIIRRNDNRTYTGYDVVETKQLTFSSTNGILPIQGGVMRYARDGVEAVDSQGKTMWNVAYNMANPVAAACGEHAAVGDSGGVSLYLLDGSGKAREVITSNPIVKVAVSANGETAVLMNGGNDNFVTVYHADGTIADELKTYALVSGFPVDIAISTNGAKVIVSYVYFEEDALRSKLVFYNYGDVGKSYIDGLVGKAESSVTKYPDNMYADVEFVTNDNVVIFGDKSFLLYEMEEIPSIKPIEIGYTGNVRRFAYSSKYIGLLTEENKEGKISYAVYIYNLQGKLVESRTLERYYGGFRIEGEEIFLYNDTDLYIARIRGRDKFKSSISRPITYVLATSGKTEYAILSDNQYHKIKLLVGEETKK